MNVTPDSDGEEIPFLLLRKKKHPKCALLWKRVYVCILFSCKSKVGFETVNCGKVTLPKKLAYFQTSKIVISRKSRNLGPKKDCIEVVQVLLLSQGYLFSILNAFL